MALLRHDPVIADQGAHLYLVNTEDKRRERIAEISQQIIDNAYELNSYTWGVGDVTERLYATGREDEANSYHDALSSFLSRGDWESRTTLTEILTDEADALAEELYELEVQS